MLNICYNLKEFDLLLKLVFPCLLSILPIFSAGLMKAIYHDGRVEYLPVMTLWKCSNLCLSAFAHYSWLGCFLWDFLMTLICLSCMINFSFKASCMVCFSAFYKLFLSSSLYNPELLSIYYMVVKFRF